MKKQTKNALIGPTTARPRLIWRATMLSSLKYWCYYRFFDKRPRWTESKTAIINQIIQRHAYTSYLEIGISEGDNFDGIEIAQKIGVDPDPTSAASLKITSDEFFEQNTDTFDLIFIDGLHHADQVSIDIANSLACLNDGGTIVCHDMNPWNAAVQKVPRCTRSWTGDCWKAFVQLRMERDDLITCVIDTDCGLGVIRRGKQAPLVVEGGVNWGGLRRNRVAWLNLRTVVEFYAELDRQDLTCP